MASLLLGRHQVAALGDDLLERTVVGVVLGEEEHASDHVAVAVLVVAAQRPVEVVELVQLQRLGDLRTLGDGERLVAGLAAASASGRRSPRCRRGRRISGEPGASRVGGLGALRHRLSCSRWSKAAWSRSCSSSSAVSSAERSSVGSAQALGVEGLDGGGALVECGTQLCLGLHVSSSGDE